MNNKNNYLYCANRLGLFFVSLFAICFVWYFIKPAGQELHFALFEMSYFGFNSMNLISFISGAVQSYIWAYLFLGLWQLVGCNKCRQV